MSLEAKAIALVILILALAGVGYRIDQQGYKRAKAEDAQAAELQREMNRARAREVETTYTKQAEVREHFIVTTVKEIRDATASLASCPVPEPARKLLNDAAACADSAAACGPDLQVRKTE